MVLQLFPLNNAIHWVMKYLNNYKNLILNSDKSYNYGRIPTFYHHFKSVNSHSCTNCDNVDKNMDLNIAPAN